MTTLFGNIAPRPTGLQCVQNVGPAKARKADPATSHEAAKKVETAGRAGTQRLACLMEVFDHPGQTSAEIAKALNFDRYTPSRRLPELRDAGMVESHTPRECRVNGTNCMTWWPKGGIRCAFCGRDMREVPGGIGNVLADGRKHCGCDRSTRRSDVQR